MQPARASHGLPDVPPEALVGSPLKKARPSIDQLSAADKQTTTQSLTAALGAVVSGNTVAAPSTVGAAATIKVEDEEEL